jgi:hypothetical protein
MAAIKHAARAVLDVLKWMLNNIRRYLASVPEGQ